MIVFDASTLILLAKIEILRAITQTQEVLISKEVEAESTCKAELLDAKIIMELIKAQGIKVMGVTNQTLLKRLQKDFVLAEGEASALVLALKTQAILATDDGQTIKACKVLGVRFITAIHFLLDGYYKRKISQELALAKLERLRNIGWYNAKIISDAVNKIEEGVKEK
jgi:predicted nucleic acid-binding protein